ncbi:uncharacterized protein NECHADRAFT_75285 [Fusarium vanettenii 77-13-4]|uniref:Uncharacterized protein n=1 Tax=Fusarium vanettenii (strain ATCC MYA-4622 / CBS 123669 / FGSC 9596 / NRRL 45880 / 77-13-4) TaxID=660122 RepID=C7YID9_FUSV7|nr:uncharacterized protein NECHADRAFT_75285 [Fusarium vanettenii 77-13-4]EEU48787.1 predicted protein [Fusarium vanettenii 77-13-4]
MAVKVVRGLDLASKLFAPGFSASLVCSVPTAGSRGSIGGVEVFKLDVSLQLVDDDVNGRTALQDTSYHRGNDPADVAGLFVDAFVAWISPPLTFIRRVRGRNRSFWIPDIVSLLMEGTYGMERGLTDRTVADRGPPRWDAPGVLQCWTARPSRHHTYERHDYAFDHEQEKDMVVYGMTC